MEQKEATLHQDIQSFDVNIVLVQLEFLGRLQEAAIHKRELLTSSKVNKKINNHETLLEWHEERLQGLLDTPTNTLML
jgi:hypothetical protein